MCSYNKRQSAVFVVSSYVDLIDVVNDTYACENDHVLNDLIKTELGFRGCKCPC
jgi:beta-glucosidase-like glycosyl hydrolase